MSKTVYEIITERIIKKLEEGVIPWRKPWNQANCAVSWERQRPYRGINALLLDAGEYATFNQISKAGGKIKKGAKSNIAVFWKVEEYVEQNDDGEMETKTYPICRYYKVFETNTQVEGLPSKRKEVPVYNNDPIDEAEKIIKGYGSPPTISFAPGRAYYSPVKDVISVPPLHDYEVKQEYYSTLFHELIHSTGHKSRLNREGVSDTSPFGSEKYSKEELIAEIGASMLCGVTEIENCTIDNSAAYINGWLKKLKDDSKLILKASTHAQKACEFILDSQNN